MYQIIQKDALFTAASDFKSCFPHTEPLIFKGSFSCVPIPYQYCTTTGYLEIGGLLDLDGDWQKLDKIRIILGDEMTRRTQSVINSVVELMVNRLRDSVDETQEKNEFLIGVPAIIHAMQTGKIFDSRKFHAKTYITYYRLDHFTPEQRIAMNLPLGYALVGSSNFTHAGLNQNIELNIQVQTNIEEIFSFSSIRPVMGSPRSGTEWL